MALNANEILKFEIVRNRNAELLKKDNTTDLFIKEEEKFEESFKLLQTVTQNPILSRLIRVCCQCDNNM